MAETETCKKLVIKVLVDSTCEVTMDGYVASQDGTLQWHLSIYDSSATENDSFLDRFTGEIPKGMTIQQAKERLERLVKMLSEQSNAEMLMVSFYAAGAFYDIEQDCLDGFVFAEDEEIKGLYHSVDGTAVASMSLSKGKIALLSSKDKEFIDAMVKITRKVAQASFILAPWYKISGVFKLAYSYVKKSEHLPDFETFETTTKHIGF